MNWETPGFADWETLPNGVCVRRKTLWNDCELQSWPQDRPWLATVSVGGWHYSSKGEATREQAISALFEYIQDQKIAHKKHIRIIEDRLKELTDYLEKHHG